MPPANSYQQGGQQGGFYQPPQGAQQQGGYLGQQQGGNYQGGNEQNGQDDELEKLAMKLVPRILKKLDGCCVVM
jgi:hypothetical protein